MPAFATDLRQALRGLQRAPAVSALVVATLGVGIGAPTAVFSVVNAALLRPLPFPASDRLVQVRRLNTQGEVNGNWSGAGFLAWRDRARSFSAAAAYDATDVSLRTADGPRRLAGASVSGGFFAVMATPPLLGRAETVTDGARAVVLGERLWRREFEASRDVIGRAILLDGESFTVAGVMPAGFAFPADAELWLGGRADLPDHPLRPLEDQATNWESNYFGVVARLRPGVEESAAQAELAAIMASAAREHPGNEPRLVSLREALVGKAREPLLILFGAVSLVLLIACVNVSHLLLARAMRRRHEIAVRVALGCSRGRVARLFFAESALLAAAGGALGLVIAVWGAPPLVALGPRSLAVESIAVDWRVLGFAGLLALAAAVVFSLLPVLSGRPPADGLRDASRSATDGGRGRRLREALMGIEMAFAVLLLAGAGLLGRSFLRIQDVDAGFEPAGVLTADLVLPAGRFRAPADRARFVDQVLAELRARPDVDSAGVVSRLPLTPGNSGRDATVIRRGAEAEVHADLRVASAGYLAALRIPTRAGRAFTAADTAASARVVLVNELFARAAWPGEDAIGKSVAITIDDRPATVVGVVGNVLHTGLHDPPRPEVYVPYPVEPSPSMTLVVRGRVPPESLADPLRQAVQTADPDQSLARLSTMEERIAASLDQRRFSTLLFAGSAGLALLLALVGVYGVIAYAVAQRRRELGIRLALGARPGRLVGGVMLQSLRAVAIGLVAGIAVSLAASRALAGMLFGVATTDPLTFAAIALVAAGTATLASLAAAQRVARLDPMTALRSD